MLPKRRGQAWQRPWPQAVQPPPPFLIELGRRPRYRLPLWPRRARVTWTIPFQAPGISRDVDMVVHGLVLRWSTGLVGSRWRTSSPLVRWATGILLGRWRTSSPLVRWKPGPPEDRS